MNKLSTSPIANKLLHRFQEIRRSKIVDFMTIKRVKEEQAQLQKERGSRDFSGLNPLDEAYTNVQHNIAGFIECFSQLPESRLLNEHCEAKDPYLPSDPLMRLLMHNYLFCWAAFDICVGIKKESYTTIMLEACQALKADPELIQIIKCMQESRMGLYRHEGYDRKFVYFRELYTNKTIKVLIESQYNGIPGEIWLVRLLPEPFGYADFSTVFTTPYVIIKAQPGTKFNANAFYTEEEWLEFIKRSLSKMKIKDPEVAYHHFMKYGLSKHYYWLEYIFQGYVNNTENLIWLTGFPDRSETLPHSNHG